MFLVDLNNERTINPAYRYCVVGLLFLASLTCIHRSTAITSLRNYVLVDALRDRIVVPPTSPLFQFYPAGSTASTVPFLQSAQYTQDLIGLRTLYARGALKFGSVPCGHQDMPRDVCKNVTWPIVRPFLN